MIVEIINTDEPHDTIYVEITKEQYDRFKELEKKCGYLAHSPEMDEIRKELFENIVDGPELPTLIWYH